MVSATATPRSGSGFGLETRRPGAFTRRFKRRSGQTWPSRSPIIRRLPQAPTTGRIAGHAALDYRLPPYSSDFRRGPGHAPPDELPPLPLGGGEEWGEGAARRDQGAMRAQSSKDYRPGDAPPKRPPVLLAGTTRQ